MNKLLELFVTFAKVGVMAPNGQILSRTYAVNRANGLVTVTLRAECLENIAAEVPMTQAEKDAVDFANLNPKEGKNE